MYYRQTFSTRQRNFCHACLSKTRNAQRATRNAPKRHRLSQKYTFLLFLLTVFFAAPAAWAQTAITVQDTAADVPLSGGDFSRVFYVYPQAPNPQTSVQNPNNGLGAAYDTDGIPNPLIGTLGNGVDWVVYNAANSSLNLSDVTTAGNNDWGWVSASATGGAGGAGAFYLARGNDGVQTWLFSVPVNLSFVLTGFNSFGNGQYEGVTLTPGTVCTKPDSFTAADGTSIDMSTISISYPAIGTVIANTGNSLDEIGQVPVFCTLDNVTALTLNSTSFPNAYASVAHGLFSLTVTPALTGTAAFSNLPTLQPGQTGQGTLTCTNTSANPLSGAACVPTASGGTISHLSCSPATPVTLAAGASTTCTFDVTANATSPANVPLTGSLQTQPTDIMQQAIDDLIATDNSFDPAAAGNPIADPDDATHIIQWAVTQAIIGPPVPAPVLSQWAMGVLGLVMAVVAVRRKWAR